MKRIACLVLALLALSIATACGGGEPAPGGSPGKSPAAPPAPPATPAAGMPDIVSADEVPADARDAYLAGLEQIDPALVADSDDAVRDATNICLDLAQDKDRATVADNARQRLSGGDVTLTAPQASKAVALARNHICQ